MISIENRATTAGRVLHYWCFRLFAGLAMAAFMEFG